MYGVLQYRGAFDARRFRSGEASLDVYLQPDDRKRLLRYPVPAVRVGRLAVAVDAQRRGIGRLLIGHAVDCALAVRGQLGVRVRLVDALNDEAEAFDCRHGFRPTAPGRASLYLQLGKP